MGASDNCPADNSNIEMFKEIDVASISKKVDSLQSELTDLFNTTPFGSFILSNEGVCLSINRTALAWLDRSSEETVGSIALKNWLTPISFEKYEKERRRINSLNIDNYEIEIISKNGLIRPISLSLRQVGGFKGSDTIYRGILVDLTELKNATERQKIESLANDSIF